VRWWKPLPVPAAVDKKTAPDIGAILAVYGETAATVERIPAGLINRTWKITTADGRCFILQRVNAMFPVAVDVDIDAVTSHLAAKDLLTPRLVRTPAGARNVCRDNGHWRLMTFIDGETHHALTTDAGAHAAGYILGSFHSAMADYTGGFAVSAPGVHDTPRHLAHLRHTLETRADQPRFAQLQPLAEAILEAALALPQLPSLPQRVAHGDPKISNLLFAPGEPRALCLIDLDRVGPMVLPLELGDALRSWCNPNGEDTRDTDFSTAFFRAALQGYADATRSLLTGDEIDAIVPATRIIHLELAARFCADALNEDYFAWDPKLFSSHSEHSEVRAAGQFHAHRLVTDASGQLAATVREVFGRA